METPQPGFLAQAAPAAPPEATLAAARWPKLAYELALGVDDIHTLAARHGLSTAEARALLVHPLFLQVLQEAVAQVRATGAGYKEKAKVIAEDLLPDVYALAKNVAVHPSIRLDAAKFVTGCAGLGPQRESRDGAPGGGGGNVRYTLQVILGQREEKLVGHGEVIPTVNDAVVASATLAPSEDEPLSVAGRDGRSGITSATGHDNGRKEVP